MDGQTTPYSSSSVSPTSRGQNLRSAVSMFIEDSRITAVANGEPPPRAPSNFYSVTTFSSTSGPTTSSLVRGRRASFNFRPTFRSIIDSHPPRACSSSPVRFQGVGGENSEREIVHSFIRDSVQKGPSCSFQIPPCPRPPPPPSTVRRRATLNVEPMVSVIDVGEGFPLFPNRTTVDRAYTSVNMTLRTPSGSTASCEPPYVLPPSSSPRAAMVSGEIGVNVLNTIVDMQTDGTTFRHVHSSSLGGGSGGDVQHHPPTNLMYSTFSNSKDGFEAQVQIHFGPGGGTFTASRRRRSHIMPVRQMNSDLLSAQSERKDKLRIAIQDRRCLLAKLQAEIAQLRTRLLQRNPFTEVSELEKLKTENQRLRIECDFMASEVDLYQNGSVPLGETDEEFYEGINPGQSIDALFGITNNRRKVGRGGAQPPPRPPPPKFLQSPGSPHGRNSADPDDVDQGEWRCSMCTFQNHRDLDYCEQCQMVRVKQQQSFHVTN